MKLSRIVHIWKRVITSLVLGGGTLFLFQPQLFAAELTIPPFAPLDLISFLPIIHGQIPANQIIVSSQEVPDWKQLWDVARKFARQKEYGAAVEKYQNVLVRKENLTQARWELVVLLLQQDRWAEAVSPVDRLLEDDAENKLYLLVKAVLAQKNGEYVHSLELFRRGIDGALTENPLVMSGMANAFFALGRDEECLVMLTDLLKNSPNNDQVILDLSVLAFRLERYEMAKDHVVDLMSLGGASPALLLLAARLHEKLSQPKEAVEYWQELLAQQPGNVEACEYLAKYYEGQGEIAEAINCLLILRKQAPQKSIYNKRIALAYLQSEKFSQAQPYLEQYLRGNPNDTDSVRAMIQIHAAKGEKNQTLSALEHYFSIESRPAKGNLQQAALLYSEGGFFREAISIYRRLLDMTPDDPELMWALAQTLLVSGQEEESLAAWQQLAQVAPGAIDVYRPMATLLEKLGREGELLEVLTIINTLVPDDQAVIFRLAELHFARHDYPQSMGFLAKLHGQYRQRVEFFKWRGIIWLHKREYAKALVDFEAMLVIDPSPRGIRLQCLRLAGLVDDPQAVNRHSAYLEHSEPQLDLLSKVIMAQAFLDSGEFSQAKEVYRDVVHQLTTETPGRVQRMTVVAEKQLSRNTGESTQKANRFVKDSITDNSYGISPKEVTFRAFKGFAELLLVEGLPYEAEELLRQGVVLSGDSRFLSALFAVALNHGWLTEAGGWLDLLGQEKEGGQWDFLLAKARYQVVQGLIPSAQGISNRLGRLLTEQPHSESGQDETWLFGDHYPWKMSRSLELVDLQISLGQYAEAAELCRLLLEEDGTLLEASVLGNRVYLESAGRFGGKYAVSLEEMGPALHLSYEKFCWQHQMFLELERVASYVGRMSSAPGRAPLFLAAAQIKLNKKKEALGLYEELLRGAPGREDLLVSLAKLYFSMGNVDKSSEIVNQRTDNSLRSDITLLRARISWLKHDWQESIAIYEEYLQPSVEDLIKSIADRYKVSLPRVEDRRTFWEKFSLNPRHVSGLMDKVMAPAAIGLVSGATKGDEECQDKPTGSGCEARLKNEKSSVSKRQYARERRQGVNRETAGLYARFRWQKIFSDELEIRRAVKGREYVLAAKKYELFVKRNPQYVHLLYDLAGVYSRLGRLGDEAALYEQLLDKQVRYPGLQEAMNRNRLKQRPYVSTKYGYRKEEGWQGQKNIRQDWLVTNVGYSPGTQKKLNATASKIRYENPSFDETIRANRFFLAYETAIESGLTLGLGGGFQQLSAGGDLLLLQGELRGKFNDTLAGHVSLGRDVVADTVTSIARGVAQNRIESGVVLDIVPRLELSADYFYTDYSDNNWTTGYDLQAAYILLSEPTFLKINYKFNFQDSEEDGAVGRNSSNDFQSGEHPYWAPTNYWQNSFGLFFKHTLGKNTLGREAPRYYTVEYSLGHFSDGYPFQTLKLAGFMEFTTSFWLQLFGELTNSQPYMKKEIAVSLAYRW